MEQGATGSASAMFDFTMGTDTGRASGTRRRLGGRGSRRAEASFSSAGASLSQFPAPRKSSQSKHPFAVVIALLTLALFPTQTMAQPATPPPKTTTKSTPEKKTPPAAQPMPADDAEDAAPLPAELDDAEDFKQLTALENKPIPSMERLLKGPPIDWLVITRANKVLEVEPVTPRPDTLLKIAESNRKPPPEKARRERQTSLEIVLLKNGEDDGAYRINVAHIKQFVYHEDLCLQRTDLLLNEERTSDAFELLTAVQQREPNWPGLAARRERLRFIEAGQKLKKQLPEQALALFEIVHQHDPVYPDLERQIAASCDQLMQSAAQDHDYRRVRHFLDRLKQYYPNHTTVERWVKNLTAQATQEIQSAVTAEQQSDFRTAVNRAELAARIWPEAPAVGPEYRRIAQRYQRLHVGTLDLAAGDFQTPVAVERELPLFASKLFEPAIIGDKLVRYHSRFIEDWEPTDLGRSILFRLRTQSPIWEGTDKVTSGPIVEDIASRLNPSHVQYDERFANYVSGVRSLSPFEFSVDFRQAPLRPESLFDFPVPISGSAESVDPNSVTTARQRFVREPVEPNRIVYRRSLAQPATGKDWYLSELVEHRYSSPDALLQGWMRGEISMIPNVPLWDLEGIRALPDVATYEFALPLTHIIQFHPRQIALHNPSLRRALAYGSNRKKVLDEIVLRGKSAEHGRLVSSPFATAQSAYNQLIPPHRYDARLAYSMMLAAKTELKGEIPKLKLGVSSNAAEQTAARELAKQWQLLGINVTVVEVGPQIPFDATAQPAPWDMLYRTVRLTDPLTDLWPCLTLDNQARVESLAQLPDWLRRELIAADEAGDWPTAERQLKQLHRDLWSEVYLIPLWEVSEFMAVRRHVRGLATRPMFPYQDVEHWQVQPWFPK